MMSDSKSSGAAAGGTTPILEVRDLTIQLPGGGDRSTAVRNVSFAVGRGEILCLVGESGSGKSVIAQSVMGLLPKSLPVTGGQILLQGEDITHAPLSRLRELRATRMAMIFQEPMTALNPVMTCGDQIDEVLRQHTTLSAEQRRAKVLDIVREVLLPDPERMVASYPHQLSGGQRQRIMIAMALVLDPVLLIADEPTTALDVTTQAQILKLVLDLQHRHGAGVLFITHDFGVVAEVAHRVAVLRLGDMVEIGSKHDVLQRPQHDYTRMLIGAVPTLQLKQRPVDDSAPVVLKVSNLEKTYLDKRWFGPHRTVHAAKAVNFEIRRGQTLGIVGESGSGKSTVARCIVRLIDPSGGQVMLGGGSGQGTASAAPAVDIAQKAPPANCAHCASGYRSSSRIPYRSMNPRITVGDVHHRRTDELRHASVTRRWQRARKLMETGASRSQLARPLPPPVLRRPAPAHLHRPCADAGARAAGGRRGGQRAGRVGAGPGAAAV